MTEGEWMTCPDVLALLAEPAINGQSHQRRRLRLFSVACCRQLSRFIVNERLWKCLDASERYADGKLKDSGLDRWTAEANKSWFAVRQSKKRTRDQAALARAHHAIAYTCLADRYGMYGNAAAIILGAAEDFGKPFVEEMRYLFPHLLRDIFGNPFRPLSFDPAWRTATTVGVARTMYTDRRFGGMPVLGDALEEAGCTAAEILAHCRQPAVHVRGCWVIDALVAK